MLADPRCPHEQKQIRDNELAYLENSEEQGYRNRYRSDSSCRRFAFQHWTSVLHSAIDILIKQGFITVLIEVLPLKMNSIITCVMAAYCENVV